MARHPIMSSAVLLRGAALFDNSTERGMMNIRLRHTWALAATLVVAACNSSGGSSNDNDASDGPGSGADQVPAPTQGAQLQGLIIDSAVSGLDVTSTDQVDGDDALTLESRTDIDGAYDYRIGDTMFVSIGALNLASAGGIPAGSIVTPEDMVGKRILDDDPTVLNIVRLLLSLDTDQNYDNGISIGQDARDNAPESLPFGSPDFDSDTTVINYVANNGGAPELVEEDAARAHFQVSAAARDVPGAWILPGDGNGLEDDDEFFLFDEGDMLFVTAEVDAGEDGGVRLADYSYDSDEDRLSVGALTVATTDRGLPEQGHIILRVRGNVMAFSIGPEDDEPSRNVVLQRLPNDGIIGAWRTEDTENAFIFLDDGRYIHAFAAAGDSQNGNEVGTYTFENDTLTFNVSNDGNGDVGPSDFDGQPLAATVNDDTLTLQAGGETVVLNRYGPP